MLTSAAGLFVDSPVIRRSNLGKAYARDQTEFLDLLLDLASYCGHCNMILHTQFETPKESTLDDMEDMLDASNDLNSAVEP
jgi:hypothetical protein